MPEELARELQKMKDEELAAFIRDTITRLHIVADHLESYVHTEEHPPTVGFEVPTLSSETKSNDDSAE